MTTGSRQQTFVRISKEPFPLLPSMIWSYIKFTEYTYAVHSISFLKELPLQGPRGQPDPFKNISSNARWDVEFLMSFYLLAEVL